VSEWRATTLGTLCELKRGYDLPARERVDGDVPIVSRSGVTGYHAIAKVRGPGVVTGRYGTLGEVFFIAEDFWPLNTALYVRDFKGNDPHFVAALLRSLNLGKNDGAAAVPGVNRNQLHLLPVRWPDPDTQSRIGLILSTLDVLIENNRRRIALLEQMAQATYEEWFVHFRYPGHDAHCLVGTPLGSIPAGWEGGGLSAIVNLDRTTVHPHRSPDELFDHYSIPAFDNGRLPALDAGDTIKSGKFLLTGPAVLVSKLNPRIERTWLVAPTPDRRSVGSTEFLVLRPTAGISLEFLYLLVRSGSFQERLRELSGGTSTSHQRAKPEDFLGIPVIAPPESLASQIPDLVGPQMSMTRNLRLEIRKLESIRDLLLPKLVTGQIDVSNLDLDVLVDSVA